MKVNKIIITIIKGLTTIGFGLLGYALADFFWRLYIIAYK